MTVALYIFAAIGFLNALAFLVFVCWWVWNARQAPPPRRDAYVWQPYLPMGMPIPSASPSPTVPDAALDPSARAAVAEIREKKERAS